MKTSLKSKILLIFDIIIVIMAFCGPFILFNTPMDEFDIYTQMYIQASWVIVLAITNLLRSPIFEEKRSLSMDEWIKMYEKVDKNG